MHNYITTYPSLPIMLPPDQSPVHILVSGWWQSRQPFHHEIMASRAALWTAATHEITANANRGVAYDPLGDRRVQWASQWIDQAGKIRPHIDPDLHNLAAIFFNPAREPSRKDLACGPD